MTSPGASQHAESLTAAPEAERQTSMAPALWAAIAVVGLSGLGILTWLVAGHTVIPFDQPLLQLGLSWKAYDAVWSLLSNAANLPLIAIGVGLVLYLFLTHRRREAILVILVLAAVTAGSEGVKQLVHRPRPPGSDAVVAGVIYSFPSGHVLEATTIFGIISVLAWRSGLPAWAKVTVAVAVAAFVVSVAVARVAIDAHYPSDVLAGFLAGIGVLAIFALLTRPDERRAASGGAPPRRA